MIDTNTSLSTRRLTLRAAAAGAAAWALPGASRASVFPDKPVKLIVPYPAGGGADLWSRTVAGKLEKVLGQPIIFDYRPGGSTTIGADAAARLDAANEGARQAAASIHDFVGTFCMAHGRADCAIRRRLDCRAV